MIRRVAAVEATLARFEGRTLAYGRDDCARMTAFCLRKLGVKAPLLKGGSYASAVGAARVLKRLGVVSGHVPPGQLAGLGSVAGVTAVERDTEVRSA